MSHIEPGSVAATSPAEIVDTETLRNKKKHQRLVGWSLSQAGVVGVLSIVVRAPSCRLPQQIAPTCAAVRRLLQVSRQMSVLGATP